MPATLLPDEQNERSLGFAVWLEAALDGFLAAGATPDNIVAILLAVLHRRAVAAGLPHPQVSFVVRPESYEPVGPMP